MPRLLRNSIYRVNIGKNFSISARGPYLTVLATRELRFIKIITVVTSEKQNNIFRVTSRSET